MGKTNCFKYSQDIIIELKGFPRPFDLHGREISTKFSTSQISIDKNLTSRL